MSAEPYDICVTLIAQAAEIATADHFGWGNTMQDAATEIARLRAALAQPAVQGEPVAWMNVKYGTFFGAGVIATTDRNDDLIASGELIRLYVHPPAQPPRQPLSDERIDAIPFMFNLTFGEADGQDEEEMAVALRKFARAVLAAAQEQKP